MKRRDVFSRMLGFLGVAGAAAALPESPKSGIYEAWHDGSGGSGRAIVPRYAPFEPVISERRCIALNPKYWKPCKTKEEVQAWWDETMGSRDPNGKRIIITAKPNGLTVAEEYERLEKESKERISALHQNVIDLAKQLDEAKSGESLARRGYFRRVAEGDLQTLSAGLYLIHGFHGNNVCIDYDGDFSVCDYYRVARISEPPLSCLTPEDHPELDITIRPDGARIVKLFTDLHGPKFRGTLEECHRFATGCEFPLFDNFSKTFQMTVLGSISAYKRHNGLEYSVDELLKAHRFICGYDQWPKDIVDRRSALGRPTLTINNMPMIECVAVNNSRLAGEELTSHDMDKFSVVIYRLFGDSQRLLNYFRSVQAEQWGIT